MSGKYTYIEDIRELRAAALLREDGDPESARNKMVPPSGWKAETTRSGWEACIWNGTGQAVAPYISWATGKYFMALHHRIPEILDRLERMEELLDDVDAKHEFNFPGSAPELFLLLSEVRKAWDGK